MLRFTQAWKPCVTPEYASVHRASCWAPDSQIKKKGLTSKQKYGILGN